MNLLQELHDLLIRYLDHHVTIEELEEALGDLALPISEADSTEAASLNAMIWRLLSEYGYGHRDEESVRRSLERAVPRRPRV